MERTGLARWGLWIFTAGIAAWTVANATLGFAANVITDLVIVVAGVVAAIGLPRAVDGIGNGPLRLGLLLVALAQFGQNLVTATTALNATNATPAFVVMATSVALVVGVKRWQEDGWDDAALPWLAAGFAGYAFEPVYYTVLQIAQGNPFGPFFPGAVLVAIGAGLAAWGFWSGRGDGLAG